MSRLWLVEQLAGLACGDGLASALSAKPNAIGKRVSTGCIRLTNEDLVDLYEQAKVGAKVIVLPATAALRPFQGAWPDAALRSPDSASLSNRPSATNAQLPSSGPKIAEVQ